MVMVATSLEGANAIDYIMVRFVNTKTNVWRTVTVVIMENVLMLKQRPLQGNNATVNWVGLDWDVTKVRLCNIYFREILLFHRL